MRQLRKVKPFYISFLFCLSLSVSGCSTLGYYAHVVNGHLELIAKEEPIDELIVRPDLDAKLQEKLKKVLQMRRFASEELLLPDNDSYKTYVKLDTQYPLWNVIAAERYSIKPKQWCFLFAGCISYRGYFNKADAQAMAAELKGQGYDVYVAGVAAYSTIGWFDDPLLSSMLYEDEAYLAGILFHELAHQKIYIDDDSSFNEAFATAVELEGVRRWLEYKGDIETIAHYRAQKQRQHQFKQLLRQTHETLKQHYASEKNPAKLAVLKQKSFQLLRQHYQELKQHWGGYEGYDKWMEQELNNAHLALVATYHELVPQFERILKQVNYDLKRFYVEVERLGTQNRVESAQSLAQLR